MQKLCPGWMYSSNHSADPDGRIIVIWNTLCNVQVLHQSRQSFTCKVTSINAPSFIFTAIYASNERVERADLWTDLINIHQTFNLASEAWLIGGDFNQIRFPSEHSSSYVDCLTTAMMEFSDVCTSLDVEDLRFSGLYHTWPNYQSDNPTTKKLDRALINPAWIHAFPHSLASFSAPEFSDHSPCVVDLACSLPSPGTKPFRFFNFLTKHPLFKETVEVNWLLAGPPATNLSSFCSKMKYLKPSLKTLSKENFSNIQNRVAASHLDLQEAQRVALSTPSTDTFEAEKEAHQRWLFLRTIEESFLRQKSRVNWLKEGDTNSAFFYRAVKSRSSYNSIRNMEDNQGFSTSVPDEMGQIAVNHFSSIMAPHVLPLLPASHAWLVSLLQFRCDDSLKLLMQTQPTSEEIKRVIFKLNPNKASGPDGFTSDFYKHCWEHIGEELLESILTFFRTSFLPSAVNATILALVPKKPGATRISDYRPISCCNTIYKSISKILVKKLKLILPKIILPNQTAFIKGRLLMENTLLASEVVHNYHKPKGPKRISIKVDIAKAFDTVRWEFLFACLYTLQIPQVYLNWLHACIQTSSYTIGFNGQNVGYFKGKRGLRQGDPLSPYLFVLVMNCLSLSLNKAAEEGKFGFHHKCKNVKLTHLSFADDLLIFCEGSLSSVQGVLVVLRDFEARSGLALSIEKTSFFSGGLSDQEVDTISLTTGISSANLPVRYLGIPLCTKKLNASHCSSLIQTIKNKLESWATKTLSYAGRVQLISTVIAGITNFWASSFILPLGIIDEINSLCARFLWRGTIEQRANAKVAWENITAPKAEGGLGLKNLKLWNVACALRMIWLLFFSPTSIWAIWFTQEILEGNVDNLWIINTKQKHTYLANALINLREEIYNWIILEVGNGEKTLFWSSNWSPYGRLETYLNSVGLGRSGIPRNATLKDLWSGYGWSVPAARTNNQVNVQCYLSNVTLNESQDRYVWKPGGHVQRRYRTGQIYELLRVPKGEVQWHKEVWFSGGIPRQRFMLWLVMLNRCPTKDRLLSWGLHVDPKCLLCNLDVESRDHLYFSCPLSATIWSTLSHKCGFRRLLNIDQIMAEIRLLRWDKRQKKLLLLVLHATVYYLWAERNSRMHTNRFRGVEEILRDIDCLIRSRIQSLRDLNQESASFMLQSWFSVSGS